MQKSYLIVAILSAMAVSYSAGLSAGAPKMKYFKNAQHMRLEPMKAEGANAFLSDVVSSNDPKAPISCGLFRMEKGKPLTYTYGYDEAKIILEGEMTVSDGSSTVQAKPGDILFFPKGVTIRFTSNDYGLGFICGQREEGGI